MESKSLNIVREIKSSGVHTFHEHHHILFDLAEFFGNSKINYVEIGCFEGASACLMMHRPNTNIFSIDLGVPRDPKIAKENVSKFNKYGNKYTYIKGRSVDPEVLKILILLLDGAGIDLLFIDGGHKYNEVIMDFLIYSGLVNKNGYIVFDDMISPTCPDVPKGINFLKVHGAFKSYMLLEDNKNIVGADFKGEIFKVSNEFVIQKV